MINLNTKKIKMEGQALTESIICTDFEEPYWLYGKTILKNRKNAEKACTGLALHKELTGKDPLPTGTISPYDPALTFEESLALYFMAFGSNLLASDDVKHEIHCVFQTEGFESNEYVDGIISEAVDRMEDALALVL